MVSTISVMRDQPPALRTDVAQIALVLGGGIEPEPLRARLGTDPRHRIPTARSIATELVPRPSGRLETGIDLEEGGSRVLHQQQANVPRVALEPAVGEGSLLEHPEPPDAVVRLSEDAHAEQARARRPGQHCRRRRRAASFGPWPARGRCRGRGVVARAWPPGRAGRGRSRRRWATARARPQGASVRRRSGQTRDQPAPVDPRNVSVGGGDRCHLARLGVDVVALEVQRAPVAVDRDADLVRRRLGDPAVLRLERRPLREPELPDRPAFRPRSSRDRERRVRGEQARHQVDVLHRRRLVEVLLELVDLPEVGVSPHLLLGRRAGARSSRRGEWPDQEGRRNRGQADCDDEVLRMLVSLLRSGSPTVDM